MPENLSNWAGNLSYSAARIHRPTSVDQIQQLVASCDKVRALGTRHSFNDIADTPADLISLEHLDQVLELDRERGRVVVQPGIRYGQLGRFLHGEGYALHNLASLPHISVAGACATATHGSGDQNGNLATAVSALEIATASGDLVTFSHEQNAEQFEGAVVGLGGLGVVTKLALEIVPAFEVSQHVYNNLAAGLLVDHFDAITSNAYSVSLFTDWRSPSVNQVWLKRRAGNGQAQQLAAALLEATPAPAAQHPLIELDPVSCTEQLGAPGPWHERLPHFRLEHTPSNGEELQTEYFVPRQQAVAAFQAIAELGPQISPLLQISEIRTIAADTLWMSPCYQQDSVAFHFTWVKNWPAVRDLLPLLEAQIAPFGARPHWGKLFTIAPEQLRSQYERLPDFQRLLRHYDPQGKFCNPFLDRYIFGEG